MSIEIAPKNYTVAEFLELGLLEDAETVYELIKGKIVGKPKAGISARHGRVVQLLGYFIEKFAGVEAGEQAQGKVFAGASCTLGREEGANYVIPDVCFVRNGRLPNDFDGPLPLVPDLIIEVHSPSDTTEKIHLKLETYREAGVPLVWSVYLLQKFVIVYKKDSSDLRLVNFSGELEGDEVLPSFRLPVSKLFE